MKWTCEGKTCSEYLKEGDKFYKFKYLLGQVEVEEVEFICFIKSKKGEDVPIFLVKDQYQSIKYFWRDYCICAEYKEGWYKHRDACLHAGKKYYIELIKNSK